VKNNAVMLTIFKVGLAVCAFPLPLLAQIGPAGDGIWRRNAFYGETQTLDYCEGHQPPSGEYHHHVNPTCLRYELGDNLTLLRITRDGPVFAENKSPWKHSPILGWAADGFPIYGPYGHSVATNASSPIKRLRSSFALRAITARTSLPTWALLNHPGISQILAAGQYGPVVSTLYPLGRYVEDYEYSAGSGDLDAYNGRFEVTPDYPAGIYAYHITIEKDGTPAFPYIFGGEFAGTPGFTDNVTVPSGAITYSGGSEDSLLSSWHTSSYSAQVIGGYDPSLGAATLWPLGVPTNAQYSGGTTSPINAAVQKIQYTSSNVYITSYGLPDYTIGPWFDGTMTGGVFANFPSAQTNTIFLFTRSPAQATNLSSVGMGPEGIFVSGAAAFNFLDGGSYSNSKGIDIGGGTVEPTALMQSPASGERGPAAPGARVLASALFGANLATTTAISTGSIWPTSLGGTTISFTDSTGAKFAATIGAVSPSKVEYRVPLTAATGFATLSITNGTNSINANVDILSTYPNLYETSDYQAEGVANWDHNGTAKKYSLAKGVPPWNGTDIMRLEITGTGAGAATKATATIGGTAVTVKAVQSLTGQPGVDGYVIYPPQNLSATGSKDLVITIGGRASNSVTLNFLSITPDAMKAKG